MTFTYDPITDIGRCRLMVPDRVQALAIFSDEEYEAFLVLEGDLKLAAALALETIASSEVYTLKMIQAGSVKLDGPSVSRALLARAALLRQQVAYGSAADGGYFDIAEMVVDPFSFRERVHNEALRDG